MLQDGHSLNDDWLGSSYIGYDGRADLGDIERIEIVRGPGSVLYRTSAVSGVINLVSRGHEEGREGSATLGTDQQGLLRAPEVHLRWNAGLYNASDTAWVVPFSPYFNKLVQSPQQRRSFVAQVTVAY